MSPEPLPETGVLTNQIANIVDGRRRRTLWLFNVDKFLDPSTPCITTDQRPRNTKWPPGGPKMSDGVWKGV